MAIRAQQPKILQRIRTVKRLGLDVVRVQWFAYNLSRRTAILAPPTSTENEAAAQGLLDIRVDLVVRDRLATRPAARGRL